jgi:aminopeptidase N
LNQTFWHQTVTGKQVEDYISEHAGMNLAKVFDQYLRSIKVPVFEYRIRGNQLSYRWADVIPGFDMPLRVMLADSAWTLLKPNEQWQSAELRLSNPADFKVDENFYVLPKLVD